MTLRLPPAARQAVAAYGGAPRSARLHIRGRWLTCPFTAVEQAVPPSGDVLEVGCGHGSFALFLALAAPGRRVTGVDVDRDKIAVAQAAAAAAAPPGAAPVTFAAVDPGSLPAGPWDAVVVVDVLYLLGEAGRAQLLDEVVPLLAPDGVLVVKEIDVRPRWKAWLATAQELVATRVARITEGDHVAFAPPDVLEAELAGRGLTVTRRRVDRGYPHPHLLLLARRAGEAPA